MAKVKSENFDMQELIIEDEVFDGVSSLDKVKRSTTYQVTFEDSHSSSVTNLQNLLK